MAKATQQNHQSNTLPAAQKEGIAPPPKQILIELFAQRYGIDPKEIIQTLIGTAFKVKASEPPATREEILGLMVVANEYHLNPFIREIYAFRAKHGGIVPIVGYDGWIRLVQRQPSFDGEELIDGWDDRLDKHGNARGFYYECTMWRKDRSHPTKVREYHNENWRDTDPWNNMPNRMTRMRSYIQCSRVCFGFGGIFDEDEGERIRDAMAIESTATVISSTKPATTAPRAKIAHTAAETTRANFTETAQAQPETVAAQSPKDAVADEHGEFKSLASENMFPPDEEEAGTRG
jgi:hypothetical protein